MERGLEIKFEVEDTNDEEIVKALTNLVGNEFLDQLNIDWRIFRVAKGTDRFYKACFIGKKLTRVHPLVEEKIRKRFDELSRYSKDELEKMYHAEKHKKDFRVRGIVQKNEEYDLWQDNFWEYF